MTDIDAQIERADRLMQIRRLKRAIRSELDALTQEEAQLCAQIRDHCGRFPCERTPNGECVRCNQTRAA